MPERNMEFLFFSMLGWDRYALKFAKIFMEN
jgi:hypothetical protein